MSDQNDENDVTTTGENVNSEEAGNKTAKEKKTEGKSSEARGPANERNDAKNKPEGRSTRLRGRISAKGVASKFESKDESKSQQKTVRIPGRISVKNKASARQKKEEPQMKDSKPPEPQKVPQITESENPSEAVTQPSEEEKHLEQVAPVQPEPQPLESENPPEVVIQTSKQENQSERVANIQLESKHMKTENSCEVLTTPEPEDKPENAVTIQQEAQPTESENQPGREEVPQQQEATPTELENQLEQMTQPEKTPPFDSESEPGKERPVVLESEHETRDDQTNDQSQYEATGELKGEAEKIESKKKNVNSITISSKKQHPSSPSDEKVSDDTANEIEEKSATQQIRRRSKDSSADVLNVIDWSLDSGEKYEGSAIIPDTEISTTTSQTKPTTEAITAKVPEVEAKPANKTTIKISSRTSSIRSENTNEEKPNANGDENQLRESLSALKKTENGRKLNQSKLLSNLMDTYLDKDYVNRAPSLQLPVVESRIDRESRKNEGIAKMEELEQNLENIRRRNKKQPPPPIRIKPSPSSRMWDNPKEQQRPKPIEKQWPPREPPRDIGAYIVESYGQTDPYTKRLIKDIQRAKREEEERKQAEKRVEIVSENTKPVSILLDTFIHKPKKGGLGKLRPSASFSGEKSWIQHEKKPVVYDNAPEEPDWMKLIRNRRWKSTVKARFPCKEKDRTEFERRSTTPKNWKKLAKDKNALKMLSEIVGVGAEGEELFMRLASQRQKIEDVQQQMDSFAQEELLAYQVARESLGEDAAYSLQMDNPLPAARMKPLQSGSSVKQSSNYGSMESLQDISQDALHNYPFTTSQLEAAYLSNQLLRLHPEEFRKLISLERSRQATLRWQFSSDPFDSVHDHQELPYELAMLATDEPRILQAMRKIIAQGTTDDYRSVFSSSVATPQPRYRRRSEGTMSNYDSDGYESSNSVSSTSSLGVIARGRKKKKPVPLPPHSRRRSASVENQLRYVTPTGKISPAPVQLSKPRLSVDTDEEITIKPHSLFDDADLQVEIENLNKMTSNLSNDVGEELKDIDTSLQERKNGFFKEAIRNEHEKPPRTNATEEVDTKAISSRRKEFVEMDIQSASESASDVRDKVPKTRHKVRRIDSNAQLNAVFRKRREISEVDAVDGGSEE